MLRSKWTQMTIVSALWGIFLAVYFLGVNEQLYFFDIVRQFAFSSMNITVLSVTEIITRMLPFFIFQMIFGIHIYRHFCSASVYYFSRQENRGKWFFKEVLLFLSYNFVYPIIMVLTGTLVASFTNQIIFDQVSLILFAYYIAIHGLWLLFTTLLVNIIAIKFASTVAFLSVAMFQLLLTSSLILWEELAIFDLYDDVYATRNAFFLRFNPVARLVLMWHSSGNERINERINLYQMDFPLYHSVLLFLAVSILVIIIGYFVVKNHDLIVSDSENGGM